MRLPAALAALLLLGGAALADTRPFQRGSWDALLQAYRGRPLIVHFWGVSCPPCLAEMPEWARFRQRRGDANIVMVQAEPGEATAAIAAPLVKAGLGAVESWRFADAFIERLQYEIDPRWQGELPITVLVARDGATTTLSGPIDFAKLTEWLDAAR